MKALVAASCLYLASLPGCPQACAQASPAIEAAALVEEAAEKIKAHAYYAERVDWPSTVAEARRQVSDAASLEDAHRAIDGMLRQLRDGHSFLLRPERLKAISANTSTADIGFSMRDFGGDVFLVTVPTFVGMRPERERAFAEGLHSNLSRHGKPRCGWIVDLRNNGGGNMFPMLAGLAPLLGSDRLGSFVSRNGRSDWPTQAIFESVGLSREALEAPDLRDAPVAVLTSRRTMSSGEAVAIAFRGRAHTRSFGEPTAGKTTGSQGFKLADGSMLLLGSVLMADRTGATYEAAIEPDQPTAGVSDEAVIRPALEWLRSGCADRAR